MTRSRLNTCLLTTLPALLLAAAASLSARQEGRTVWDGVYTEEQAARGELVYQDQCTFCHLDDLMGDAFATPLIADAFTLRWDGGTLGDLMIVTQVTMPADQPNTLTSEQVADVIAFLLKMNEYPTGDQELPADQEALEAIAIVGEGGQ